MARPYFSIVMPVYNREGLLGRALRSCLAQAFTDFEVVVVDDGSTDGSVAEVRAFDDPRVRLILHGRNRGRCPARNTGMAASRGEWFIFFDSDDELLPGALETIHRDAAGAPADVTTTRYSCIDERGRVSPDPPYPNETWTYERYLQELNVSLYRRFEALPCSRTSTFPEIAYPESHAEEGLYHLELARRGRMIVSSEVVRLYHGDARNQISRPDYRRALRYAPDAAANVDTVLARHGEAMRRHAPVVFAATVHEGVLRHFMAGRRAAALRYARQYVRLRGLSVRFALIVALGMIGGAPLAIAQSVWARR